MQFDRYTQVEKVSREQPAVEPSVDEETTIGALTDFNLKKGEQRTDNPNGEDTQDSVSLTPEEIEKKRVEEFRKKRKEDLESLQEEYDALQGKPNFRQIKPKI